jgi:DNA-directed RNA polymerase specialized sigma24 family protein
MTVLMPSVPQPSAGGKPALASRDVQKLLSDYVKRRVPGTDAEDVVQTVLCEALASPRLPEDREELRRFLIGVARNKVADHFRKSSREAPEELPELEAPPAPIEARGLVEWAERQTAQDSETARTLDWMAREGEGEKLESIAEDEHVPATRVRQRVSRMRRWMKERWLAELALVAAVGLVVFVVWRIGTGPEPEAERLAPMPQPTLPDLERLALDRARSLRELGLDACGRGDAARCVELLDEAARLDPAGDQQPEVRAARDALQVRPEPGPLKKSMDLPPDEKSPRNYVKPVPTSAPPTTPQKPAPKKPAPTKSKPSSDFDSFGKK